MSVLLLIHFITSLNNNMGLTPPMGWFSREYCKESNPALNENIIKETVNSMAQFGIGDAGYKVVLMDDCWMAQKRSNNQIVPDPNRFPSGMDDLSQYIHNMGYSLGLTGSIGASTSSRGPGTVEHLKDDSFHDKNILPGPNKNPSEMDDLSQYIHHMGHSLGLSGSIIASTSSQGPGTVEHFKDDSFQFAHWGVDYVNLNDHHSDLPNRDVGFPTMSYFLNSTEKPMIFSCGWGSLNIYYMNIFCNVFRVFNNTINTYVDVLNVVNSYEMYNFTENIGPGGFTDAGPIIVGSVAEVKSQLAIWSMLPSPLFISQKLISEEYAEIYKNPNMISLNQDRLGMPGFVYRSDKDVSIWMRHLNGGRVAVIYIKRSSDEHIVYATPLNVGREHLRYKVTELWSGDLIRYFVNGDWISVTLYDTYTFVLTPVDQYELDINFQI